MRTVAKALVGLLGAVGAWGVAAFEDGISTAQDWFGLLVALGAGAAVYLTPNADAGGEPGDGDE